MPPPPQSSVLKLNWARGRTSLLLRLGGFSHGHGRWSLSLLVVMVLSIVSFDFFDLKSNLWKKTSIFKLIIRTYNASSWWLFWEAHRVGLSTCVSKFYCHTCLFLSFIWILWNNTLPAEFHFIGRDHYHLKRLKASTNLHRNWQHEVVGYWE